MKIVKVIIMLGLPALTILLFFSNYSVPGKMLFSAFILFVVFERLWEGLYTSKDQNSDRLEGDWTLPISIMSYVILIIFCLIEFYYIPRSSNLIISAIAICLYIGSIVLRLWAMKSLGDQWSVHIIGVDKLNSERRLIRNGPYKYIRHPVYLGIMVEQISIPLVANLYYTAIIAACFTIPFQIIKAVLEEREMIRRLGKVYEEYNSEISRFIPFKK